MTGKDLYDELILAWSQNQAVSEQGHKPSGRFLRPNGPAWPYLTTEEKNAFTEAATALEAEQPC